MNYDEMLTLAEKKLNINYSKVIEDLKARIAAGSTGGEISSMVGHYLLSLKTENPDAFLILENDIEKYILSCRENGLHIT